MICWPAPAPRRTRRSPGAGRRAGDQLRLLTGRLARAEQQLSARVADPAADPEAERLKKRLREQGTRLRELQDRLAAERAESAARQEALTADLDRARADAQAWRKRAEVAAGRADAHRKACAGCGRRPDDRRGADDPDSSCCSTRSAGPRPGCAGNGT